MGISLSKGQRINLAKDDGGELTKVDIGLGWDPVKKGGFLGFGSSAPDIDCDASVFCLTDGKLKSNDDIVYFGHKDLPGGSIHHCGDNLTGHGDGDDEVIEVYLNKIPATYDRLVFIVNIYQSEQRKQDFGMIENAFIRIVDATNHKELMKYSLTEKYAGKTAMIFGEVYRKDGKWKFNAIGEGTPDNSISQLARRYQ
jgi:stress response protein SCP2